MTTEKGKYSSKDIKVILSIIRTVEAEKRTHLAELRTGIGIMTIPLSLLTILIAFSEQYSIEAVFGFIAALTAGIFLLLVIGGYLVARSFLRLRRTEKLRDSSVPDTSQLLGEYMDDDL